MNKKLFYQNDPKKWAVSQNVDIDGDISNKNVLYPEMLIFTELWTRDVLEKQAKQQIFKSKPQKRNFPLNIDFYGL